jgi:hypothetical protein
MKVTARLSLFVGVAAFLAALPVAFVVSGMRLSGQAVALAVGASVASVAWLWALAAVGVVRQLGFSVGAVLGFLSFVVVAAVFMLQPAAEYSASWRVASFAWVLLAAGWYPVLIGGLLGYVLRKASAAHAL